MRKVKFLQDWKEYKMGDIIKIDRNTAHLLQIQGIVTYYVK